MIALIIIQILIIMATEGAKTSTWLRVLLQSVSSMFTAASINHWWQKSTKEKQNRSEARGIDNKIEEARKSNYVGGQGSKICW
jgi:hypothetical protein